MIAKIIELSQSKEKLISLWQAGQREFGLSENHLGQALLLAELLTPPVIYNGPLFYLAKDNLELKKFSTIFSIWNQAIRVKNSEIAVWPGETPLSLALLYSLIKNENRLIACVADSLEEKTFAQNLMEASVMTIKQGQKYNYENLVERLVLNGYDYNLQANQPGIYSRRGNLIDLWSPNYPKPLRLEFDGQLLEKLYFFNPLNQKIEQKISEAEILPIHLEAEKNATVKSYLNENASLFSGLSLPELESKLISSSPKYSSLLKNFQKELKQLPQDWQVFIITEEKGKINALLKELDLENFSKNIVEIRQTWPWPVYGAKFNLDKKIFLTDYDIFGFEHFKKRPQTKVSGAFIAELKENDYVVHSDHGVAKYGGLKKAKIDDIEREYFLLLYAANDKLYLPIEQADKIDKYLGPAKPKIQTLGKNSNWPSLVKKIKEDTVKTAKELLEIYAQRELSLSAALADFPEEQELADSFPYTETPDQLKALAEVFNDLSKTRPADRLICGDVGYGKTEVAIRAGFKAVLNNCQVAVLCPTTILAQQHEDTFKARLKNFGLKIKSLSRFQSPKEQKIILSELKSGQVDIVIGTHRLLSSDVAFSHLGLIIIDEEQRFGVKAKEKLKKIKAQAHVITLTATPIPRTLHLSLSGTRDISVIETPPEGRLAISTELFPYDEKLIKQALTKELERQGQAYYLYNDVETIGLAAKKLGALLPSAKIGIAHGQLKEKELAEVMHRFDLGEIDILVCSTIIENGLDLPNANTLIVENSARFGLAQLYQLRGRIGRGDKQAYAYFLYKSEKLTGKASERLKALEEATELGSGFQLALRDMEIRGVGNILGKEQHGKVTAIGLSLYQRLLEQTVEELKAGEPLPDLPQTEIDLPLVYGIDEALEPSQSKRLNYYQKLTACRESADLAGMQNDLKRKFSQSAGWRMMENKFNNLISLLELKLASGEAGISSIDTVAYRDLGGAAIKKITVAFKFPLDYQKYSQLLEKNPYWQDSGNKIKIDLEKLGDNWLENLKKTVELFHL